MGVLRLKGNYKENVKNPKLHSSTGFTKIEQDAYLVFVQNFKL